MDKILIVGDLHGDYESLASLLKTEKFSLVFQLGDLGLYTDFKTAKADKKTWKHNGSEIIKFVKDYQNGYIKPLPCPVYYIKGNHDDYDHFKELEELNLFNIDCKRISRTTLNGTKISIAGFGGIFSPVKYGWDPASLKGRNRRFYTEEELVNFANKYSWDNIDILLTHEAAKGFMPHHEEGKEVLRYLVNCIQPKYYLHGHHHYSYETSWQEMSIIGIGNFGVNPDSYKIIEL